MCNDDDKEKELNKLLKNSNLKESTKKVLSNLSAREAKVLKMRFGIDLKTSHSLEEVGMKFDITRERIREIEKKALARLKNYNGPDDDGPDTA